jgi:hypothetical protein
MFNEISAKYCVGIHVKFSLDFFHLDENLSIPIIFRKILRY